MTLFKDSTDKFIVTAGADGFIKFWDASLIENSEGDDFGHYYIEPVHQI